VTTESPIPNVPTRRFLDAWPSLIAVQGDPFRRLEPEIRIVQFGRPLTEEQLSRAGRLIAERPDVWLRVHLAQSPDLAFLKYFSGLRLLDLEVYDLESLNGLAYVRDSLEAFHFGKTEKVFPLRFLQDLPHLRNLFLGGHRKEIDVLSRLVDLMQLSLRGITLPDLALILPLTRLRGLSIHLGGTSDLRLLPRFSELEEVNLLRITGLSDLSMLAELTALKTLTLDWLRNVTTLPSLAPLQHLETVSMETMKGLTSLASIAAAPALQRLQIITMPQLKAADFTCLVGHPSLRVLMAYPGGKKVNDEIKRMFPGVAL
jgi:hypothetical protein